MTPEAKIAIALLGHGSRAAGAAEGMEKVAEGLRASAKYAMVEVCHMSQVKPSLPEALETCARQGATSVIVIPYFLHMGVHILADIPEMMREASVAHPGMKIILGKNLGFDESLVALVEKRIEESRDLPDIREDNV